MIMANDYFRFKEFTIQQSHCAMKVGTDGVLLGAWVKAGDASIVLDIGSGTGLIALMVAQKCEARIVALEPDSAAFRQAEENIRQSPWADRIQVVQQRLQDYKCEHPFDLMVCNPPFYSEETHSPLAERDRARYAGHMTPEEILSFAGKHLSEEGRLNLILPAKREEELFCLLSKNNLFIRRLYRVKATPEKEAHRILAEASRLAAVREDRELIIEQYGRHQYSKEYIRLCRAYYLHM